jgi:peptidoglycan/LPS O-acetylase OafA/YrhL
MVIRDSAEYSGKKIPLEAIRGLAALVVVAWHTCLAFFPTLIGVYSKSGEQDLQGNPLFLLIHGPAAVSLFFVLSGYVLTRHYFATGNNRFLLKGAVKRWPRLMGPVLLVVLGSYFLFKFNLYDYEKAGAISGSSWLTTFGSAYDTKPPILFWDAFSQGAYFTFFRGDYSYDSSIWTMHLEFVGSFIAFGFAPILFESRKCSLLLTAGLILIVSILAHHAGLGAFPIGVGLAVLLPSGKSMPGRYAIPALCIAFYLLGFSGALKYIYEVLPAVVATRAGDIHIIASAILIAVAETYPPLGKILSGQISRFLGDLSFPVYLVHVPIICSIGSATYLVVGAYSAALVSVISSVFVSLPLITFSRAWLKKVNAATALLIQNHPDRAREDLASVDKENCSSLSAKRRPKVT